MKHLKGRLAACAALAVLIAMLAGCGINRDEALVQDQNLSVYASFYPFYAFTEMLIEDVEGVQLHCLVQPQDGCLRDYRLSDWDLSLLAGSADAVIAGGNGLESFESVLYALGENGPAVSCVLYDMELIEQPAVNTQSDADDSHWLGGNPHIYMSIDGAAEITARIAATLSLLDAENEQTYAENLENAQNRLKSLLDELRRELNSAQGEKVIVMNEALLYAAQAYGVEVDLCYERESGEGLEDYELEVCLDALAESDAKVIVIEKQAPAKLCLALEDAGYRLARMDTMSTRRADEGYEAYFEAHRENAQALLTAVTAANTQPEKD